MCIKTDYQARATPEVAAAYQRGQYKKVPDGWKAKRVKVRLLRPNWLWAFLGLEKLHTEARYRVLEVEGATQPAPGQIIDAETIEVLTRYEVKVTVC